MTLRLTPAALAGAARQPLLKAVAAALCGLGLTLWLGPAQEEMATLENAVQALQARQQGLPAQPAITAPLASTTPHALDAPGADDTASLWPWLQRRLQAHRLHVLALQPQAVTQWRGLPEQAVQLRLQGRWSDWLDWLQALHAQAPWWVIDQWQVLPAESGQQTVRIELQARLALRPTAWPQPQTAPRSWPDGPDGPNGPDRSAPAHPVWLDAVVPDTSGKTVRHDRAQVPLPDDPRQWPVAQLRLLGVWREGAQAHAVLGQGMRAAVVRHGQRIGREGHRVAVADDHQVSLHPADAAGPVLRLRLQEEAP